jgi:serine/threonine protein kinase
MIYKETIRVKRKAVLIKLINMLDKTENQHVLKNDVEALINLQHSNIVKYYEYFLHENYFCVVMNLFGDKNLKQSLAN